MDDASRRWLDDASRMAKNHTTNVRGTGIVVQCAGCRGWFNVLTLVRGVGFLCGECADGFRSILDRRRL